MRNTLLLEFKKQLNGNDFVTKLEDIMHCDMNAIIEKMNDEEIKDIITTDDVKLKISKFYLYSKQEQLSDDIKVEIKKHTENNNVNVYSALDVIEKYSNLGRTDIREFVEVISDAPLEYQARCAKEVALDQNIYTRSDAINFVSAIAYAREFHQAEYAKSVALDMNVLRHKKAINFVRLIKATPFEYQAKYAMIAATDLNVLKSEDAVDIVRVISNSLMEYQAKYASFVALNENVLARSDALEIVSDVASAKNSEEAQQMAIYVENILRHDNNQSSKVKVKK